MKSAIKYPDALGVGVYSIPDAARLVGTHPLTVRRWIDERGGVVPRRFGSENPIITFVELIELYFVKMFRNAGVTLKTIRRVSETAAKRLDSPYPFAVRKFDTDGRTIFATALSNGGEVVEDLNRTQYVFKEVMRPFFRKLEYRDMDETVIRFWPRGKRGRIVLDPLRKFGKPIDSTSGVSTSAIYDAVRAGSGQTPAAVAGWLGIPIAAVNAAIAFEKSLAD